MRDPAQTPNLTHHGLLKYLDFQINLTAIIEGTKSYLGQEEKMGSGDILQKLRNIHFLVLSYM